jgi:hypothetical protein
MTPPPTPDAPRLFWVWGLYQDTTRADDPRLRPLPDPPDAYQYSADWPFHLKGTP